LGKHVLEKQVKIFDTELELAEKLAEEIFVMSEDYLSEKRRFNISLSGGRTPKTLFAAIVKRFGKIITWNNIHLFWGDERCVPFGDYESNYIMTKLSLIDHVGIPNENIHRIIGENEPHLEAERYSNEILTNVRIENGLPSFDLMLLGIGEDGHTASIFPDQLELMESNKICEVSVHPVSLQKRITLSGKVINNSKNVLILATGESKSRIVSEIILGWGISSSYPVYYIHPVKGEVSWYLDKLAANLLHEV
jgi:6-phosphogluconolactonase